MAIGLKIEIRMAVLGQFHFLGHGRREFGRILDLAQKFAAATFGTADTARGKVQHAFELAAQADWPVHRHASYPTTLPAFYGAVKFLSEHHHHYRK